LKCIDHLHGKIQLKILDEANAVHPNTWWWLKADGADVVSGLGESVKGQWSGDVDLADGALERSKEVYRNRMNVVEHIGKSSMESYVVLKELITEERNLIDDVDFIAGCECFSYIILMFIIMLWHECS